MTLHPIATAILALAALPAFAWDATPPPPPSGCASAPAAYHQFDFWIGRWEVRDRDGKTVFGHSVIEAVSGGCGISERWTGAKGSNGVSLNAYDSDTNQWQQFWIGNQPAGTLTLRGGLVGNSMVLSGVNHQGPGGRAQTQRITWTPNPDGRVRQQWESSDDEGHTWVTAFDGWYRRVH